VICSETQLVVKPDAHPLSLSTQRPSLVFRYADDRSLLCFVLLKYGLGMVTMITIISIVAIVPHGGQVQGADSVRGLP